MTASIGQTAVVNAALSRLGARRMLNSIDDSTDAARKAKSEWPLAFELLIEAHPWNFALRREALNSAETVAAADWDFSYTLPADCLRWLPHDEDSDDFFLGVQEGDAILCNEDAPLNVRYISRTRASDLTRWSASFREAMVLEMAARLAETITQNESVKRDLEEGAARALIAAKRRDGLSSGKRAAHRVSRQSGWLAARDRPYQFNGR